MAISAFKLSTINVKVGASHGGPNLQQSQPGIIVVLLTRTCFSSRQDANKEWDFSQISQCQVNHVIVNHTYMACFFLLPDTIFGLVSQAQVCFINICCQSEKRNIPESKIKSKKYNHSALSGRCVNSNQRSDSMNIGQGENFLLSAPYITCPSL